MKNHFSLLALAAACMLASCNSSSTPAGKTDHDSGTTSKQDASKIKVASARRPEGPLADAATIMARKEVPILCYHHIRDLQMPGKASSGYEVTVNEFKQQMKILSDSGYHSVLPDQLYDYLTHGTALPDKPFMITFDDTDGEQFTIGKTEMDKYGFKGVYFIMTISMNRPRYMTKDQIKQLSNEGHVIACHTWDHHMVTKYTGDDWEKQLDKPKKQLETLIGKPIEYFAYPFGLWNQPALPELKKRGYKLAFQLSTKRDPQEPLLTVRRMIVSPEWSAPGVLKVMRNSFH
jgi:peptidoglycan/xylan/chitin deacetylase (PgdA/CDA1 family)